VPASAGDPQKVALAHNSLRTMASTPAKVGCLLWYQVARRKAPAACAIRICANKVMTTNYEDLTVEDIVKQLDGLTIQQLEQVREYEKQNKDRETLIEQIERKIRIKNS
jgi:hypothetical protein